jgi:hypothetical protein
MVIAVFSDKALARVSADHRRTWQRLAAKPRVAGSSSCPHNADFDCFHGRYHSAGFYFPKANVRKNVNST